MPGARISFAFYTGLGAGEPLINRITAMLTGRYMHCEIVFHERSGAHVACGVWQGERTFMRRKTFGKRCWTWLTINVTPTQMAAVRRFCAAQARRRVPFNQWGLWRCCTPFPRKTDGSCWFCSELCVAALQAGGLLLHEVPSACTPTYVHTLLREHLGAFASGAPGNVLDSRIARHKLSFGHWSRPKVPPKRPPGRAAMVV